MYKASNALSSFCTPERQQIISFIREKELQYIWINPFIKMKGFYVCIRSRLYFTERRNWNTVCNNLCLLRDQCLFHGLAVEGAVV